MGVYSINNESGTIDLTGIIECKSEPGLLGALDIVVETQQNYNAIMKAVGISELACLESTGQEIVYEGAKIDAFVQSAKKMILNVWEKIKGLFKKFFAMMNSFIKNDKEFANKYKSKVVGKTLKEYKGYNFKVDAVTIKGARSAIESHMDGGNTSETIEKMMGSVVGGGSLNRSELIKELYSKLRGGESSKQTIKDLQGATYINILLDSQLKDAKDAYKETEDSVKKMITTLENEARTATKADDAVDNSKGIAETHAKIALTKQEMDILSLVNGSILTAIKDRNRQAKSICVKLISQSSETVQHNSAAETNFGGNSFLEGVVIK